MSTGAEAPEAGAAGGAGAAAAADGELDERDAEPRTPMKRLGSTRKLAAFNNIRLQLAEHTRVLEARGEAAAGVASELHDYCRRRADLEHDYARALDKLARAALQRHKEQRHKRERWPQAGAFGCWRTALEGARRLAADHGALAELYGGPLAARTQRAADDVLRLHRRCRDLALERQEHVGAALADAAAAGKAHAAAALQWRAAAHKLRLAHDARQRLAASDPPRHKKLKALDKELDKRRSRHSEARGRALRARADYQLSLEAANATLQRYYLDDIADIMLCAEVGFETVVGRVTRTAGEAERARADALTAAGDALLAAAAELGGTGGAGARLPRFPAPRPLAWQGAAPAAQDAEVAALLGDAAPEEDALTAAAAADLAQRLAHLEAAARALRAECHENAKTLDAAEAELVRQMEGGDVVWSVAGLFGRADPPGAAPDSAAPPVPPVPPAPPATPDPLADGPRREQEDYYLAKFRSYVSSAGRLARLESKAAAARARLGAARARPPSPPPSPPRRAAARLRRGQFAAPLDGAALPAVLTSCVRVIAAHGLRHQGVFRVSGSQVEMHALRAAFERGEDPLAGARGASDVNTVCGLLKLWLRELRPPLVPPQLQERLLRVAALPDDAAFVASMARLVGALPQPALLVLRYLFAFLAHLAAHADRNMMDAWNLAICVGPTLLAAWPEPGGGGGQLAAQNLANELVKRTIQHHAEIFPQHIAPHTLYVPPAPDDEEAEAERAESDAEDDPDAEADAEADAEPCVTRDSATLYDDEDGELSDDADDEPAPAPASPAPPPGPQTRAAVARTCPARESRDEEPSDPDCAPTSAPVPAVPAVAAAVAAPALASAPALVVAPCRRLETTPDLVLDLPARAPPDPATTPATTPAAAAPASPGPRDAADTFAHNRDTLKKRAPHARRDSCSDDGAEAEVKVEAEAVGAGAGVAVGAGGGSPVPARNTARVAAQFADLTLTGGSLKPALAAKPALLRRPTPHPHHAPHASHASPHSPHVPVRSTHAPPDSA